MMLNLIVTKVSSNQYNISPEKQIEELKSGSETETEEAKQSFTLAFPEEVANNEKDCEIENNYNVILNLSSQVPNLEDLRILDLSNCKLTSVPNEFKILRVKELNLSHNLLKKIPLCLHQGLSEVEILNLGFNNIREFDLEPYCRRNLKVLILDSNPLSNPPDWFLHVKADQLEEFSFNENKVETLKRKDFPIKSAKLRKLYFRNCELFKNHLQFMKTFPNLECLDLSNNLRNKGNDFPSITTLLCNALWIPTLKVLKLQKVNLKSLPEEIGRLSQLRELYLDGNNLDELPQEINKLEQLKVLNIARNSIYAICDMSGLTNLEYLDASFNYIPQIRIEGLKNLKVLDLYNNELEGIEIDYDTVDQMDLEQNYFGPSDSKYEEKLERLRSANDISKYRKFGSKLDSGIYVMPADSSEESTDDTDAFKEDDEDCDYLNSTAADICEENWEQLNDDFCGVTLSDTEYMGDLKVISKKSISNVQNYQDNDRECDLDEYFVDAD